MPGTKYILSRASILLGLMLTSTLLLWGEFNRPDIGIDDANIYLVYAKNFSQGHGLVYNVGGERVEGFSSVLWLITASILFLISDQPEGLLLGVSLLIAGFGILVAWQYMDTALLANAPTGERNAWAAIYLLLLVLSPFYLIWNGLPLMENPLWSALLMAATATVAAPRISQREIHLFAVIGPLLLLTRPEALAWLPVFLAILLFRLASRQGLFDALNALAPAIAASGLMFVCLTLFRILYFGYPFPNTYYAKVAPATFYNISWGLDYLIRYFRSTPLVSISILAVVLGSLDAILYALRSPKEMHGTQFLPIVACAGLIMPVLSGGDHFGSFRHYHAVYPILMLSLLATLKHVFPRYIRVRLTLISPEWHGKCFLAAAFLIVVFTLSIVEARNWRNYGFKSRLSHEFVIAQQGRDRGTALASIFSSLETYPSVAVITAGGVKFTYPGEIVDLMGLNNVAMAHNGGARVGTKNHAAFEKLTFYDLNPDVMMPEAVSEENWTFREEAVTRRWATALKGLYKDDVFRQRYIYARINAGKPDTMPLRGWLRRDFAKTLAKQSGFQIETYEFTLPSLVSN